MMMEMEVSSSGASAPEPAEVGQAWQRAKAMRATADWRQEDPMEAVPPSAASSSSVTSTSGSSADVQQNPDRDRQQREWHDKGKCTPCGYFTRKSDGCWKGAACDFCHYCDNNRYQVWKRRERRSRKREVVVDHQGGSLDGQNEETGDDEGDAMRWQ
eukprot:TRINITY_DN12302_c0_g2_i1.p1 TRINITY_DN12302_c0_g2~~TRINITY_DN12302_c0_g2_i1.p1  ORF type:complete len:157 (+),score=34.96 TRINITY_DN12302_c0_g2_i1:178-648(+)